MGAVVKAAATADSVVGGTTTAAEAAGTVTLPGTVSGGGPSAAAISGSSEHVGGGVTSAGGQQQSSSSSSTSVPQGRVKQLQSVADRLGCTLNQMMVAWAVRNQVGKQNKILFDFAFKNSFFENRPPRAASPAPPPWRGSRRS